MKNLRNDSLGGFRTSEMSEGACSSRACSALSKKKKKSLFNKLRTLDRKISRLRLRLFWDIFHLEDDKKLLKQINKLDLQRKNIRLQRKGYNVPHGT